jgi:hypothetical protein
MFVRTQVFPFEAYHVVEKRFIISKVIVKRLRFIIHVVKERLLVGKFDSPSTTTTPEEQVGVVFQEPDGEANLVIHK